MDTSNIPDSDATNYSGYREVPIERKRKNTRVHVSSEEEDIEAEGPLEKRKKGNMYPKGQRTHIRSVSVLSPFRGRTRYRLLVLEWSSAHLSVS